MITLNELPPSMRKRAEWARQTILDSPEKVEVDFDELLAWVYCEEDGVWYSIDGNYSSQSPKDKMEKRAEREAVNLLYRNRANENAEKMECARLYFSNVRKRILERDENTCQKCKRKIDKLQVHHIVKQKELRIDTDDNLITLCHKCHKEQDGKDYGTYNEI